MSLESSKNPLIGNPQLGILWSCDSLGYKIMSQLSTEIGFLVVLNIFLRDLFSQAEESSQAQAGP